MASTPSSLILWTGPKHTGKTTSVAALVQTARAHGYVIAGCLAPSVYVDGSLVGFDIVDVRNDRRMPLARRQTRPGTNGRFQFAKEGWELGNEALSPTASRDADLIVVDEFGPLELGGEGWRVATDRLMKSTCAVLLLVVREEVVDKVRQLYRDIPVRVLAARQSRSIDDILAVLGNHRVSSSYKS